MRNRWLPIGLVALVLFAMNLIARLITFRGHFAKVGQQMLIATVAISAVAVLLIAATIWWAVRYPLGRVVADLGAAVALAAILSVTVGPYVGGSTPFANGLGYYVGQFMLFLGLAAVGILLGYLGVVAFGKDWKGRGLRRYEQNYRAKPHRTVRG
jgi:hypothetical protein